MKIIAHQQNEIIICKLPNGKVVEITMVSVHGEDVSEEVDIHEAVRLVHQSQHLFDSKI